MDKKQAAQIVKGRYAEYLQPAKKRVSGKPSYICPLCGNGTGKDGDGMSIDPHGDGTQLHCFKCGFHGDIVDLYQQENGCTPGEAFRALYDRFGIAIDAPETATEPRENAKGAIIHPVQGEATEGAKMGADDAPDFTAYYKACKERMSDPAAQKYLTFRGISPETAARYWLGYDPAADPASAPGAMADEYKPHPCPRLIIPFNRSNYVGRRIDGGADYKKMNNKDAKKSLFNPAALYNEAGRPVFITEGALDALSVIEAGSEAVALNSASNTSLVIDALKAKRTQSTLILCIDNDDAGKKAAAALAEGLQGLNVPFVTADICGNHKDPNEALTADRAAFIAAVQAAERNTSKPYNTADYIRRGMAAEIEVLRAQIGRKTGFSNLDAHTGSVYAGLYCVGAISSLGKTTFVYQLCDQMAAAGEHILYFSMEQSRLEMVSKSIARQTRKNDAETAVSSIQIRTGAKGASISRAVNDYLQSVGDRMSIIEGNYGCTVSFIGETARQYRAQNGKTPVIVVDYLQVLRPDVDPDTGRKPTDPRQIVDSNLIALKRLSRELETPVFVICSVNRSNYLTPIDFEAFKESGAIEFTADVVWGLQLEAMNDAIFEKEGKIKEKRETVAKAKAADPRKIELVCLKNRFGKSRYNASFNYYPAYDYFEERNSVPRFSDFTEVNEPTPFDAPVRKL